MDIRITNTCNNNCLYCLEQEYRDNEEFISSFEVFKKQFNENDKIINFYGGNPLLHPELLKIIKFYKNRDFTSISILTNTYGLSKSYLNDLITYGLTSIGVYFNSFNKDIHNKVNGNGIKLKELIKNLNFIKNKKLNCKIVIHINKQNIGHIFRDIFILSKKFNIKYFEFVNYFPFDRAYDKFNTLLSYNFHKNRNNIDNLFKIIKKLNLNVKFVKFSKDFFGIFSEYYDYENGILSQISEIDYLRINEKRPFCFSENRCESCFIKNNCKHYENRK